MWCGAVRGVRGRGAAEDDHQVRYEIAAFEVTERDDAASFDLLDGGLDHADSTFDDELAGCHDGCRLLALEHGAGDLGRVGQLGDARFDDGHTGGGDSRCDLAGEFRRDLISIVAQGHTVRVRGVIRIGVRDVTYSGLSLDGDELLEIIDFEQCLSRVLDLPDDHCADFDRIAIEVIDFERRRLVVADARGDLDLRIEGVDEAQSRLAHCADVLAVELQDDSIARSHGRASLEQEHRGNEHDGTEHDEDDPERRLCHCHDESEHREQECQNQQDDAAYDGEVARHASGRAFPDTFTLR